MSWIVKYLTDDDRQIIRDILSSHEPWLRSQITGWPKDGCFDTCATILDDLREQLGNRGFRWKFVHGQFVSDHEPKRPGSAKYDIHEKHVWIEVASGEIIDPTAGQFVGGNALHFFEADDLRYQRR